MAESVAKQSNELVKSLLQSNELNKAPENEKKLKHLGFIQEAVIYAIVCFSEIYQYAKENSGPLKPGVQAVEDTVKTVIEPVYTKFHDVPVEFLQFIDRKVDESLAELNEHVPSLLKQASKKAMSAVSKAPEVTGMVTEEVQRVGVVEAAKNISQELHVKYEPVAKELYSKYEPVAEQYTVAVWRGLNRLPLFPQVAHIVIPTAAHWSERYNQAVCYSSERGCTMATYFPLIPVDRIAKVFEDGDVGRDTTTIGESVVEGQS